MRSAGASKAKREGDTIIFGGNNIVNAVALVAIVGFSLASFYVAVTPPPYIFGSLLFGGLAMGGAYAFPAPIVVSPSGLRQTNWWGRTIGMPWQDVTSLEFHRGPSATIVADQSGRKVVHSGFHRGRDQFLEICQSKTHLRLASSEF